MCTETRVYIAIGSNIEPRKQIPRCLDLLRRMRESTLIAISPWYRTRPWGIKDQPDFVNLVVGMDTCLGPRALLGETQAIETHLDRVRGRRNGPRTIDLDILLFGDLILAEADLRIPHPGLLQRDFMLVPLLEIAPDTVHPGRGLPVRQLGGEVRHRQIVGPMAETD